MSTRVMVLVMIQLVAALGFPGGYGSVATSQELSSLEAMGRRSSVLPVEDLKNLHDEAAVREMLRRCEEFLRHTPDNHEIRRKAAYLSYRLGWLFAEKNERKDCYFTFFDHASRAAALAPQDYQSMLLLAVAKAKIVEYQSHADQVRLARELASEVEALVRRQPNDPDANHLLSWLNFKVGSISPVQKILAAAFFGGLPKGLTVDKAFVLMDKAMHLRPEYVVYQYDLGFFYLRIGAFDKARLQFEQVLARQVHSAEDRVYQRRAMGRLRELETEG